MGEDKITIFQFFGEKSKLENFWKEKQVENARHSFAFQRQPKLGIIDDCQLVKSPIYGNLNWISSTVS